MLPEKYNVVYWASSGIGESLTKMLNRQASAGWSLLEFLPTTNGYFVVFERREAEDVP